MPNQLFIGIDASGLTNYRHPIMRDVAGLVNPRDARLHEDVRLRDPVRPPGPKCDDAIIGDTTDQLLSAIR
jgi:hypothetical protein